MEPSPRVVARADEPPVLSIVVVSYNTREMTLDCLRSVFAETETPFELIVVDNASEDGSAAAVAAAFPGVMLLAETENHGFAGANNLAVSRARGEYVLLLNPDTVVLDRALDRLLAFARRSPEARIWGGRTLYGDRSLNPTSCFRRMTLWNLACQAVGLSSLFRGSGLFNSERYGGWDHSDERPVDIVTGCLFLMRRDDWDRLGGFDTTFFMYGEEADLCLRAIRDLGARPRVTPEAEIVHYLGASQQVRADKMVRTLKAKAELIRRHFPPWQRPLASALFWAMPWSRRQAMRLAAAVVRRPGVAGKAAVWAEVWDRRPEWRNGFG